MARPILVDTDVMVDFLRGHPKAVALIRGNSTRIILSSIAAAELYAGVKGDEELSQVAVRTGNRGREKSRIARAEAWRYG